MTLRPAHLLLVFALATLVNTAPLLFYHVGGDIDFQLMMIRCFAGQFWQGDIYPRWCMSADAGLGAPLFVLYFPLPFYVASLFYPLTWWPGVNTETVYILSIALATFLTAASCYSWLKDIVSPSRALLVAVLFLFLPYRNELAFFRSAYSEVWCLAFWPLMFKYTRRIALGSKAAALPLAASVALCLLSHVPAAAVGLLGCGLYLLAVVPWRNVAIKLQFALAILWGVFLSAFYMVPAFYYKPFLDTVGKIEQSQDGTRTWSNDFLNVDNWIVFEQYTLLFLIIVTLAAVLPFACYVVRKRVRIHDVFLAHETYVFAMLIVAGFFLWVPLSKPIYALLGPLNQVLFPWRMQGIMIMGVAYLAAIWMQYFVSERGLKTWKSDYAIFLCLLVLLSYFIGSEKRGILDERGQIMTAANYVMMPEYRTRWTDKKHFSSDYIIKVQQEKTSTPLAGIIKGEGVVVTGRATADAMQIATDGKTPLTLRLQHLYFPIWRALGSNGEAFEIEPEQGSGQMLLSVPAGEQKVALSYSMSTANKWVGQGSAIISALAFLGLCVAFIRRRA